MTSNNVNNPALVGRTDHPLQLRREEIRLMQLVYSAEAKLVEQADNPDRDRRALETCFAMLDDSEASNRDRRLALKSLEKINCRLDTRNRWISEQATERLKIKAALPRSSSPWQPDGVADGVRRRPPPDPELDAMIANARPVEQVDTGGR